MFIKNNPLPGSDSLECERQGLLLIQSHFSRHRLKTPRIFSLENDELHLEEIEAGEGTPELFAELGRGLAALHRVVGSHFGLEYDNYIGLNLQKNACHERWGEFFVKYRLEHQIGLVEHKIFREEWSRRLERSRDGLVRYLNRHNPVPSLLHGDLWAGNVLFSKSDVYVIDPAVYYGDRECDLAMTKMFGGFIQDFYSAYETAWPLPSGFAERAKIYNMYHSLNHYNLFGEGYLPGVLQGFDAIELMSRDVPNF